MALKVGELYAELGIKDKGFSAGMAKAEKQSKGAASGIKSMSTAMLGMAAAGVVAAAAGVLMFLKEAVYAASDMAESVSKAEVVFGSASKSVVDFSKTAASAMGMSQRVALEYTGTLGNLFVSMGLAEGKSADMSITMVKLAADLASLNNTRPEDALEALRAGLVGETEPLRRYGVNLNDAALQQKALSMGLIKTTGSVLPPAIKAQAAYAAILEQSTTAQGNFKLTQDGLANSTKIATAQFEDAKVTLGEMLLPIATVKMQELSKNLAILGDSSLSAGQKWAKMVEAAAAADKQRADHEAAVLREKGAVWSLQGAIDRLKVSEQQAGKATKEATAAWVAQTLVLSPQKNNLRATVDTIVAAKDAHKALADFIKGGGKKSSAEYTQMLLREKDAFALAKIQAQQMTDKQVDAAVKSGELSKKVGAYIKKINNIPKVKTTEVDIHAKGGKVTWSSFGLNWGGFKLPAKSGTAFTVKGFSQGGLATGATSGYPAILHGREVIVNPRNPEKGMRALASEGLAGNTINVYGTDLSIPSIEQALKRALFASPAPSLG